jgi:glycosyltransferase involved in cell wall biosynthesis
MTSLKLIVNCGPCEAFIGQCLQSVRAQTNREWQAYVNVDPCGDETFSVAMRARDGDARIHIQQNAERRYAMHNLVEGVRRSGEDPEDVIVVLDGDDWLSTNHALSTIAEAYSNSDCWMTYGSWISNRMGPNGKYGGMWPAYPPETTDFRHTRWLGTAMRTWKRWLWEHIDDRDLRDDSGEYLRVSEDQAVMLPLLEMSGTSRARHIPTMLMVYNKRTPWSTAITMPEEILRNARLLEAKPSYARLTEKVYTRRAIPGAHRTATLVEDGC